ncbi:MAG: hypothetical protein WC728_07085 [Elusimicrobiota bacterium]
MGLKTTAGLAAALAALVAASYAAAERETPEVLSAAPDWVDKPYVGLQGGQALVGVGASEIKPDPDITKAVSFGRAALNLLENVKAHTSRISRDYEELRSGEYRDEALKGKIIYDLKSFCYARSLKREYGAEESAQDEGLSEFAAKIFFPPSAGLAEEVSSQDYADEAGNLQWTRVVMPRETFRALRRLKVEPPREAKPAPSGGSSEEAMLPSGPGLRAWRQDNHIYIMDYVSEVKGESTETRLQVRLRSATREKVWLESRANDWEGNAVLLADGATTQYVFNQRSGAWNPLREPKDIRALLRLRADLDDMANAMSKLADKPPKGRRRRTANSAR